MKTIRMICAFIFLASVFCYSVDEQFILMTTLYNEQREDRYREFLTCLEKNNQNALIKKIIIIYEGCCEDFFYKKLNEVFFLSDKIFVQFILARPQFSDFFLMADQFYKNEKIIICNADIYFDDTIAFLSRRYLRESFIALTRWDVSCDGKYELKDRHLRTTTSQDSWCFIAPIKSFFSSIPIGVLGCDPSIAYYAFKAGLKVLNPSKAVRSYHVHQSNIRTYIESDLPIYGNLEHYLPLKQIGISRNRRG
ncbi:MAG: hypothetical protein WCG10_02775 [Chlamydiota bacterium]